ncbi:hypothetical protein CY0110_18907 [Crocosphaera chwakensis CCY0110]|uniref:Uncharacterized protein n=1 Tax=Crocosphaera chwakensis CCY0110 TaxID=391612 RepID=A3IJB3_9CHRO|nr:hypothetical protein CY0110_18907 [Crocosphaera chwakensis CCY0110]
MHHSSPISRPLRWRSSISRRELSSRNRLGLVNRSIC